MKTYTLEQGTTLYRGTQFSKETHPSGPAWFALVRDVAKGYAEQYLIPNENQKKQYAPGTRKYRVLRDTKLFDIRRQYLETMLAFLGEKAGLGDRGMIDKFVSSYSNTSDSYWPLGPHPLDDEDDDGVLVPPSFIEHNIDGLRPLLAHLCKAIPSFHGYRAHWTDGTFEVVLCNPKAVLKSRARQPVDKGMLRERARKERERNEEWDRGSREEGGREKERQEQEFIKSLLLAELSGHGFTGGGWVWKDPEYRKYLKNWRRYVSPREIEEFAEKHKQFPGPPRLPPGAPARFRRRMAARVAARWLQR